MPASASMVAVVNWAVMMTFIVIAVTEETEHI
jgi:hypothetical protein